MQDKLRHLPQVQSLLETELAEQLIERFGREDVTDAIREKLAAARFDIMAAAPEDTAQFSAGETMSAIAADLEVASKSTLQTAINATGVIIHTNLGRARLAPEAIDAIQSIAADYSTLELDQETGKRGSRHAHVEALVCKLTGAEAAIVVNNCAGAILTCLCALGANRDVIASRGEMVEIGGSFRMPDVITQSGARLVEIGTTNKTHLNDYAGAVSDQTAILLKSHTSNYAVVGFTSTPTRQELSALAKQHDAVLVEDLGSGVLIDLKPFGLSKEPVVREVLDAGVDVVTFSGDKLLGGPQAGIIAGKKALIDKIKSHPMARAVRIDKLSLSGLRATLELYCAPNRPTERIPVLQTLSEPIESVQSRAESLVGLMAAREDIQAELVPSIARAGAGSLPNQDLPSYALALTSAAHSADQLAKALRLATTPILGRITKDQLLLDMRAVAWEELKTIADAINALPAQ